jgi:hypothetical protein
MPGITVPSLMEKNLAATRATLQQIQDRSKWGERGIHQLGNGLSVDQQGNVTVEKRSVAPTTMEIDDMYAKFQRFQEWLKSEGADQMAAENRSQTQIVQKGTDPLIGTQPVVSPADLAIEFGTPIDVTEIITLCEETGLYEAIPEVINGSQTENWREKTALEFASGTAWIGFTPGGCPEELTSTTGNATAVTKKHIGIMSTLTESDIQHSIASIAAGYGVRYLVGPANVSGTPTMVRDSIRSLMDKKIKEQMITVLNGWDSLLVKGNDSVNTLEFDGMENMVTAANGARSNVLLSAYSGTFSATRFDEWLAAGCAKPTHIFGHPTALQALQLGYWGLGSNSQNLNFTGTNIVPGLTFGMAINTAIGRLPLVADSRFTRTDHSNGTFSTSLFALRMVHNGEPLVYKATQIPLSYKELPAGCSAISFETWAVTALVIKHMCAHGVYRTRFDGLAQNGCNYVFGS